MPQSLKSISLVNESKALPLRRRASLYGDGRMAKEGHNLVAEKAEAAD